MGHLRHHQPSLQERKAEELRLSKLSQSSARQPNAELLEHERKRAVEVKLVDWADEQGLYDQE